MRNSLRILHVIRFRYLVKLFFFFFVIIIFVATFMLNKDEYIKTHATNVHEDSTMKII